MRKVCPTAGACAVARATAKAKATIECKAIRMAFPRKPEGMEESLAERCASGDPQTRGLKPGRQVGQRPSDKKAKKVLAMHQEGLSTGTLAGTSGSARGIFAKRANRVTYTNQPAANALPGAEIMSAKLIAPLDPDIAEMEGRWRESGIPGLYVGRDGPVCRERARNVRALLYPKPKLPTGKLERFTIPGPNGPIAVEVVEPVEGPAIGTLVYYHGGGYVIGDIDSHQAHAIRFANRSRVVVVDVGYRRTPEHPSTQSVNAASSAARLALQNSALLGVDHKPMAAGGESVADDDTAANAARAGGAALKIGAEVPIDGTLGAGGERNGDAFMY